MVKTKTYSTHNIIALVAILLPLSFSFLMEESTPNLVGILISDNKPEFNRSAWFDGSYQNLREDYNNDHWAFKEKMVRLNNQFYYAAFNQIRVNGFVIGKDDYVFSEGYIFSAFGDDVLPETEIKALLMKAKVLQDTLKKKGINLLLVYAPGKGEYCKEFVQDKYVHPVKITNHDLFVRNSKSLGIHYLDILGYFRELKSKSPYPLFPKFGHHWSYYGACLAADTLIGTIEKLHQTDLPDISWTEIDVVDTSRSRDADVLKSMNLLNPPTQNMMLAYPKIKFEPDSIKNTTRVLTISDSYWYDQVYMGVPTNCFAAGQFWYYYNRVIPSPVPGERIEVWQLDLKQEIEKNKVIVLLYSDGNLPKFGNGFIEDAYQLYTNPLQYKLRSERNKQIQVYAKQIRETPVLLKKSTTASDNLQISLDSAIKLDALKMAGMTITQ